MADNQKAPIHHLSDGGIVAELPASDPSQFLIAPATSSELNTVHLRLIPIACFRIDNPSFHFDSSFVLPRAQLEMQAFASFRKNDPRLADTPVSVFGHADPSYQGNFELGTSTAQPGDDYNKTLSGRRAIAIYALLIREPTLWDRLYTQQFGGDVWDADTIQIMLDALGQQDSSFSASSQGSSESAQSARAQDIANDSGQRRQLFSKYMDFLCGELKLDKSRDFLARGAGPDLKGDVQGCSRFNPDLLFSTEDEANFKRAFIEKDRATLRDDRDVRNAVNRRVMVLVFRKGSQVLPAKWPCPTFKEASAGCKKRFWSDGDSRRSTHASGRESKFEDSLDTFACRFYQRVSDGSPCERGSTLCRWCALMSHVPPATQEVIGD